MLGQASVAVADGGAGLFEAALFRLVSDRPDPFRAAARAFGIELSYPEAALAAGSIALGSGTGPAVGTVLAFRFVTLRLLIVPGFRASRSLRRRAGS